MMNGVKGHPLGPSFAVVDVVRHRRPTAADAPRGAGNPSTAAASSSPARGPAVLTALPSSLLLSQPCLHFGRQPQHSSYEPKVASTDLVKLDKASQLVPADVQQALLKAYEEAAAEEE